ncbi:MAG: CoA pyrophosphatase, partial [Candidatus Thermoplasmatota archaeon]|nr:CoA pyrophosphatase [Candidatus Thermoplasmatota archaeon]
MDALQAQDRQALLEALAGRLHTPQRAARTGPRGVSGVLVPFRWRDDHAELIFTRRSAELSSHPGQISFPGGRVDPGDAHPLAAALRETEEEVGIPADAIRVAGHLTDYQPYHGPLICTYVGVLEPDA